MTSQDDAPIVEPPGYDRVRSSATEYVVIAAIILVVLVGAITLMGERLSGIEEGAEQSELFRIEP